jgi:hypothetical protein
MQVYFTLEGPIPRSAKMKQTPPPRHRRRTHAEHESLSHTRALHTRQGQYRIRRDLHTRVVN